MEVVANDFSLVEVRMIQSMWETKAPEYIAWMLERPLAAVERKIKEMNVAHRVKLHQRPTFTRKIVQKQKDEQWLKKPEIKIPDSTGKISVRIDSKTIVMVKPGTDIEKYKNEYLKRRAI